MTTTKTWRGVAGPGLGAGGEADGAPIAAGPVADVAGEAVSGSGAELGGPQDAIRSTVQSARAAIGRCARVAIIERRSPPASCQTVSADLPVQRLKYLCPSSQQPCVLNVRDLPSVHHL